MVNTTGPFITLLEIFFPEMKLKVKIHETYLYVFGIVSIYYFLV